MAYNNVFTLRKNQFLIFMCISALLLGGCKRHAAKTITMDIDTVQVKDIRVYGKYSEHVSVLAQNKHGRTYEAWGYVYNNVIGGAQRGDWLVIDANTENHPWGEPDITFIAYENSTTGKVNQWYARYLRQSIQRGQDSIILTNKFGHPTRTVVIRQR